MSTVQCNAIIRMGNPHLLVLVLSASLNVAKEVKHVPVVGHFILSLGSYADCSGWIFLCVFVCACVSMCVCFCFLFLFFSPSFLRAFMRVCPYAHACMHAHTEYKCCASCLCVRIVCHTCRARPSILYQPAE